jgi:hypothetical protein
MVKTHQFHGCCAIRVLYNFASIESETMIGALPFQRTDEKYIVKTMAQIIERQCEKYMRSNVMATTIYDQHRAVAALKRARFIPISKIMGRTGNIVTIWMRYPIEPIKPHKVRVLHGARL